MNSFLSFRRADADAVQVMLTALMDVPSAVQGDLQRLRDTITANTRPSSSFHEAPPLEVISVSLLEATATPIAISADFPGSRAHLPTPWPSAPLFNPFAPTPTTSSAPIPSSSPTPITSPRSPSSTSTGDPCFDEGEGCRDDHIRIVIPKNQSSSTFPWWVFAILAFFCTVAGILIGRYSVLRHLRSTSHRSSIGDERQISLL